jgi:chaperonin GroES
MKILEERVTRLLRGKMLVKQDPKQKISRGGVHLPDSFAAAPQQGTVLALGPPRRLENGMEAPWQVAVGDRIIFQRWSGHAVREVDETPDGALVTMVENDVLAILD